MVRLLICYVVEQQRLFPAMRCFGPKNRQCHLQRNTKPFPSSPSPILFLSTSSSRSPISSTNPANNLERSAKLVKNTDVTNPYLDQVRAEVVDPTLQLKTVEDELCGAIGKALGMQGEKVLFAIREMKKEHTQYLESIRDQSLDEALQSAERHNSARKRAIKARWELLVHRQAVGFTVDNHRVIHQTFPITEALPARMEEIIATVSLDGGTSRLNKSDGPPAEQQPAKKVWGDQLAWWEQVGRWK